MTADDIHILHARCKALHAFTFWRSAADLPTFVPPADAQIFVQVSCVQFALCRLGSIHRQHAQHFELPKLYCDTAAGLWCDISFDLGSTCSVSKV